MTPLMAVVLAALGGVLAVSEVAPPQQTSAVLLLLGVGGLIVAGRAGWAGHRARALGMAVGASCSAGAGLGGLAEWQRWAPAGVNVAGIEHDVASGHMVRVAGRLRHDAARTASGGVALDLQVARVWSRGAWRETSLGARVTVVGERAGTASAAWTRGRWVDAPVSAWRRPLPYRNFGLPDAERALARQGVRVFASVKSASLVQVSAGPWWEEVASRARAAIRAAVAAHVPGDGAAAVVTAILIGDRSAMDPAVARRLQHAGVYHVVAISGGNVAVWMALLVLLPRSLALGTRAATTWLVLGLLAFACVVDGGPSVARAVTVAAVVLVARWWDLPLRAAQALALAAGLQVATDPLRVHDAGCVLSFAAAGTLVWCASSMPRVSRSAAGPPWRRALQGIGMVLGATAAIEIVLLPLSVGWFGIATAAGLVANLVAVPAMGIVQLAGLALLPATLVSSGLAVIAGHAAAAGVQALLHSADVVHVAPWLVREVPPPARPVLLLYYAAVATAMTAVRLGRRRLALGAGAVVLPCLVWMISGGVEQSAPEPWTWHGAARWQRASWPREPWLLVTVLDVGQGDATVVRFPHGRTWLVDAGGSATDSFDVGERVTSPALWALGHRRLSRVVVTHAHPDHAAGVPAVLRRLGAREVLTGVPVVGDALTGRVADAARAAGTRERRLRRGETLIEGGVRVTVLHPEPPDWERRRVRNDDSVVLWLRFGDVGLLLPGDVGQAVEATFAGAVRGAPLGVLKIAHHGSASSTGGALLEALAPALAIGSSGRGNRFGHPASAVLQRLATSRTVVLRTDAVGAIQLATNGRVLLVRTATGQQGSLMAQAPRRAWWPATPCPSARDSPAAGSARAPGDAIPSPGSAW